MSKSNIVTGLPTDMPVPPACGTREERVSDSTARVPVFAGASIYQFTFSFAAMLGACLVGWVFLSMRAFKVDADMWWHVRVGQDILSTHHLPTADSYSFTAVGHHWLAYEWLSDVFFAAVSRAGGLRALGLLLIVLGSLISLALFYFTSMRCGNPKAGFLATAVLLFLATPYFSLRPQMLGYLFLIVTLIVLERFRQGKRGTIWLLPPLMILWVNSHGSWVFGMGTVAVYLASGLFDFQAGSLEMVRWNRPDRRQLAIVLALCAISTLITPYGPAIAKSPFEYSFSLPLNVAFISEWRPMRFALPGDKLFLVLVLGFLVALVLSRFKWRLEEIGLFLFAAAMACIHLRFLLVFVPFFAPLFAVILARWLPRYDRAKEIYVLNAAMILAIAAAMVWYFPSPADYVRSVSDTFPVGAVEYLNRHPVPGPMFNSYGFGGYLVYARSPEQKVFIDGRGDLYERAGVFKDYLDLLYLRPGALSILDKYGIQSCLLDRDETVGTVLDSLPQWQRVYSDGTSRLFVRNPWSDRLK